MWEVGSLNRAGERGLVYELEADFEHCRPMTMTLRSGVTLSWKEGLRTLDLGPGGSGRTSRSVELDRLEHLQIFSDTSSLEVFVNGGREVFTTRVYGREGGSCLEGCDARVTLYDLEGFCLS